jgi:hypothetical protein
MATLDVPCKVVPVNMLKKEDNGNEKKVAEMAASLVLQGYTVGKICCGECDQDDLLVQVHTCNPHNYTHNCTPKKKSN